MSRVPSLAERFPPDCTARLERAAQARFHEASALAERRPAGAIYLFGYAAEICLGVAHFRLLGFAPTAVIDPDTRRLRLIAARQSGRTSDPHPIVGWALLIDQQRRRAGPVGRADEDRLRRAVNCARAVYKHWRPELRYKATEPSRDQLAEVRAAAEWLLHNHARL